MLKQHSATAHLPVLMYALDPRDSNGTLLELDRVVKRQR